MNYAVYGRVSTEKDEQISSIENQIDICRNWLERNGYKWDKNNVYVDEGITGTIFLDRPAIQMILDKAKKKEIEMVLFKSIHRLARDLKDALEIREVFTAYNVRVISIEEGYDSFLVGKNDMQFEMWSLFAAQYPRTLSISISAALAAKVRRGEHIGKVPYGYNRIDKRLVINEEEAKVVQQIYNWYNQEQWGFKRITQTLNELGIKPKIKEKWQVTTIQRILKNQIYYGTFIHNQFTTVKIGGRKKQIRNPREKWFIFEKNHPAIISYPEYEMANNREYKNNKKKFTPWNEFRGIVKCFHCGSNIIIVQSFRKNRDGTRTEWKYLKCSKYRRCGPSGCINHVPIRYEAFREFVLKVLQEKGTYVKLNFDNDYKKKQIEDRKSIGQKIEKLLNQKKSLLEIYLDHLVSKDEFEEKRREIDKKITKYQNQIHILTQDHLPAKKIETIHQAFQELHNQDLHFVVLQLIEKATLSQDGTVDFTYTFEKPL